LLTFSVAVKIAAFLAPSGGVAGLVFRAAVVRLFGAGVVRRLCASADTSNKKAHIKTAKTILKFSIFFIQFFSRFQILRISLQFNL
jgi:hypothetical protein